VALVFVQQKNASREIDGDTSSLIKGAESGAFKLKYEVSGHCRPDGR
jgi:hypothetical protein